MKHNRLSIWYLVFPVLSVFLIWPMIAELPPLNIPSNLNWFQVLIASPFYLGILAAPGYIYAWSGNYDTRDMTQRKGTWVKWSLWSALVASIGGLTTIMAVVPFPAVLGSGIFSILLLRRFYKTNKVRENEPLPG